MSFDNPYVIGAIVSIIVLIFGIGVWVGAVNADRRSFKEFMTEVRDDLKKVLSRLPPRVYAGDSPIELTDLGRNISTRLNGKEWAEEHATNLREKIKGREPYEVHRRNRQLQEPCRSSSRKVGPRATLRHDACSCPHRVAIEGSTQARGSRPAREPQPAV